MYVKSATIKAAHRKRPIYRLTPFMEVGNMLQEITVRDLINMVHDIHYSRIRELTQENEKLRLYKELIDKSYTNDDLAQENIALRNRVADLEKEVKSWRKNGTPF